LFFVLSLVLTGSLGAGGTDPGTAHLKHLWTFEDGTCDDLLGDADGVFNGENIFVEAGDLVNYPNPTSGVADSWVDLPGEVLELNLYDEVAVAAWFTPNPANSQWETLWFFGNDGNGAGTGSDGFAFQARRADTKARTWVTTGAWSGPYSNEDGVDDVGNNYNNEGELYYVVCQINNLADQGQLMMYHNADLIGTTDLKSDVAAGKDNQIANISPNFARFCHSCYSGDQPWLGNLHEIMIFDKALSDDEVMYLFDAGVNGFPPITSVKNKDAKFPQAFSLSQNYPNPFNPTTNITFTLKQKEAVKLTVYDVMGKQVATLLDEIRNPGEYTITFDAKGLISGVYYYRLQTKGQAATKKLVLMR
jgi:hypothetical protein